MNQSVEPAQSFNGVLKPPSDKSISHRSALFAAISRGESTIRNFSSAADPASTLSCLRQLGVQVQKDGNTVVIRGAGRDGLQTPDQPLDCGNSGTTMRLLSGIVAGAGIPAILTGDDSLRSRTMRRIIDPLTRMGCRITGNEGTYAPLQIDRHQGVKGMRYELPIASAQLKSSILLAGLFGEHSTEVIETIPSRDHTERLLQLSSKPFGTGKVIQSSLNDEIPRQNYTVPGDFSAAAFWLVAATIRKGSNLLLEGVGMNPSRIALLHILKEMGADILSENPRMEGMEPVADLRVQSSRLKPIDLDPGLIPNCIDEIPILLVAMCFADGESRITEAGELRHKETDRLMAMGNILKLAGAGIEELDDGMIVHGNPDFIPAPAAYPSYHDHRMAMSAAILGSASKEVSEISDAECTAISYPDFWTDYNERMIPLA